MNGNKMSPSRNPKGEVTMKNIWAVMKTADFDTGC
jgi:hypothetical protein